MYLRASDERHDRVMLTDVKDVFFQRDPFAFDDGGAALCVFEEDRSLRIADCPLNATWLVRAFGEVALGHLADRPILCSGTTSGRIEGIAAYCDAMVETLRGRGVTWIGGDQGVHNFLVYTGRFGTARAFLNEDGPVLTLAARREVLKRNPSGFLVNRAGEVPNVLHQYDRSPALLRWAGARYMTFSQRLWVELAMAKKTLAARN